VSLGGSPTLLPYFLFLITAIAGPIRCPTRLLRNEHLHVTRVTFDGASFLLLLGSVEYGVHPGDPDLVGRDWYGIVCSSFLYLYWCRHSQLARLFFLLFSSRASVPGDGERNDSGIITYTVPYSTGTGV